MGYGVSKKMLPLIVLRVLMENANENHMLSMKQMIHYVREYYEPYNEEGLAKLISANIKQLNVFFEDTHFSLDGVNELHIEVVSVRNEEESRGYIYKYYLSGNLFSDNDIRLLCDSILFSPGIGEQEATTLIRKVRKLSSKHFGDCFEYVKYTDMVKRTDNDHLFSTVELIGYALKCRRMVTFQYRRNGELRDKKTTVSPFHLVISAGRYYVLCNKIETETISPYRLDRMENVTVEDKMPARKLETLRDVQQPFYLRQYMEEHPRMSFDKTISVTMLVSPEIMEAVNTEFCVKAAWWIPEKTKYRVRIISTKNAICNWVINVTDQIVIESSSDKSIFDVLCNRATSIMNVYRLQAEM